MTSTPSTRSTPTPTPASSHPGDALSRGRRALYVIVLGTLTALGPFTIDLYLPAFPRVEADLGVTAAMVQLTLTGTTVGFAVGQLVMGPWSDRVGRRLPLLLATSLHILASVGAAFAPDIVTIGVFRVLQGAGAAAGAVVAMATVRDLFGGKPLARMLSRLALVNGMGPILAPLVGSALLQVMPWRGLFLVLACYGVVVVVAVTLLITETLPPERRTAPVRGALARSYRRVLGDRVFVGMALIGGMSFAGLFSYISSSAFLFQQEYGLSAGQYGVLFAVNSLGIVAGVQLSSLLMRRIGPQWVVAGSGAVQLLSAIAIVVVGGEGAPLAGILVGLFAFILATGFTMPAVQVLALARHGREAGTAASVLGATNFGLAGLISPIVGVIGVGSAAPMGAVMTGTALVSVLVLWLVVRPRGVPALED
ncbi:multidrug effflux MFS transporter [Mycetocola reblochoni]|uniref:Multidrug resistance transporter, Bcr/CflA family n=1 Tax=Mycetocola reblochoni REB411 TaxID=1255698 RepID=A0A1R4JYH2_9MICO|nr:multidrug effflux MFS transporter [Mycetocola reblochoni]SJN36885.1 Multidrug resistance transporter, Bcr/CflA family [Mycetocola reblochoni REB411]